MIVHAYKSHTYSFGAQSPLKLEIHGMCGNTTPFHALPDEDVLATMASGKFLCFTRKPHLVSCKRCLKCTKLPLLALDNTEL